MSAKKSSPNPVRRVLIALGSNMGAGRGEGDGTGGRGNCPTRRHVLDATAASPGGTIAPSSCPVQSPSAPLVKTLEAAAERIGRISGVTVVELSPLYRSEPAYLNDQAEFCNAVLLAEVARDLDPLSLLHELQVVEQEFGRVRTVPNGPRTLDVDIIDIEGVTSADPELLLPHPLALERDFVVTPLLDVSPSHVLANGAPVTRETITCGRVLGQAVGVEGWDRGTGQLSHTMAGSRCNNSLTRWDNCPVPLSQPLPCLPPVPLGSSTGVLSICATPIGNLGDLTLRVIETLRVADLVLAEDTRVARKLLNHLGIRTNVERCDENTIRQRSARIVERVAQGERIAYVSDAGMPGIADPGSYLVAATRQAGLSVEVLPGPSAVLTALVASGLAGTTFYFGGFLPRKRARIIATLEALASLDTALVFFESPHRTAASLDAIAEVFTEREVVLARELTKLHEEVLRDGAPALAQQIAAREQEGHPLKGEVVLVIAPPSGQGAARTHTDKYAQKAPSPSR